MIGSTGLIGKIVKREKLDRPKLFFLSLATRAIVAALIIHPGYIDSAYYSSGALRLAPGGAGFSEPFIWNYLGDPATIPHPGFLLWMSPFSLLAALFATLFLGFLFVLQVPFVVVSAMIPLVAYDPAWRLIRCRRLTIAVVLSDVLGSGKYLAWRRSDCFRAQLPWSPARGMSR
jgi:hypothetical protein